MPINSVGGQPEKKEEMKQPETFTQTVRHPEKGTIHESETEFKESEKK